ncbi:MAG: hypothetical protein D3923_09870 [Candidatus Electrothrix sp. AR3]|nr:hypothetical protein [Candidatus Electrothrix sp. AR3]
MQSNSNIFSSKKNTSKFEKNIMNGDDFNIQLEGVTFDYGHIRNYNISFLSIAHDIFSFKKHFFLVNQFLSLNSFIQAIVYDEEYDYWQNAKDPLLYKNEGKLYDHLPMKSNGRPFPLEQKIIDVSNNPGKRIIKNGYIEAVGSWMWLGDLFWKATGTKKDLVLNTSWLDTKQENNDVLFIKSSETPFTNSEGQEGIIQKNLRKLLFENQ